MRVLFVGVVCAFLATSLLIRGLLYLSEATSHLDHVQTKAQRRIDKICDVEGEAEDLDLVEECHQSRHVVEQSSLHKALAEALEPWGVASFLINEAVLVVVMILVFTGMFICITMLEKQRTQFMGPIIGQDPKKHE